MIHNIKQVTKYKIFHKLFTKGFKVGYRMMKAISSASPLFSITRGKHNLLSLLVNLFKDHSLKITTATTNPGIKN